jgi:hypothetical protein
MSNPEAAPLNPADVEAPSRDAQSSPPHDELHDLLELDLRRRKRAPLHILILYGLSFVASGGGLGAALLGYIITLTAPLDDYQRKQHRESYEKVFVGMKSVVILVRLHIKLFDNVVAIQLTQWPSSQSTFSGVPSTSTSRARAGKIIHGC